MDDMSGALHRRRLAGMALACRELIAIYMSSDWEQRSGCIMFNLMEQHVKVSALFDIGLVIRPMASYLELASSSACPCTLLKAEAYKTRKVL